MVEGLLLVHHSQDVVHTRGGSATNSLVVQGFVSSQRPENHILGYPCEANVLEAKESSMLCSADLYGFLYPLRYVIC